MKVHLLPADRKTRTAEDDPGGGAALGDLVISSFMHLSALHVTLTAATITLYQQLVVCCVLWKTLSSRKARNI